MRRLPAQLFRAAGLTSRTNGWIGLFLDIIFDLL
jgi:hypothetical protein